MQTQNGRYVSVNIMGGLGNQMFQLAVAYLYAKKYSGNLVILRNKRENDGRPLYWDSFLKRFQEYLVDKLPDGLVQWHQGESHDNTLLPQLTDKGIYLNGYLQNINYLKDSQEIVKELFKPSINSFRQVYLKYQPLIDNKDRIVVVHARRTDYLRNQDIINYHGPLSVEYYKSAINKMCKYVKNPIFLLSSDDSSFWVSVIKEVTELTNNFFVLEDENEINTLILLQQFYYFIIANSTFSWWASYLAKDIKKIFAPRKWYGPSRIEDYSGIYRPEWELV
jgi:hypothetical protein